MCKDYKSLEMASFIGGLQVLAPKNCFITPRLCQRGPAEERPQNLNANNPNVSSRSDYNTKNI